MPLRSKYFTVPEFDCHDGTAYPEGWADDRLQALCETLDVIREAWGGPLFVVSGYRSAAYNARVGGAKASQHVQGRAADVRPTSVTAERVRELHDMVLRLHAEGKLPRLGGLGIYGRWIHVDVRAGTRLARWTGAGVGSELA